MKLEEIIKTRRSTRRFSDVSLTTEQLEQIIEAGRYAPTGSNSQSTHFIVIRDRKILKDLAELVEKEFAHMEEQPGMYRTIVSCLQRAKKGGYVFHYYPQALIITANQQDYSNNIADCACAIENMMLMANELDLGSCWINQLKWLNQAPALVSYLQDIGMEENERVYGAVAVGHPDTQDGLPERKSLPRTGNKVTWR